MKKNAGAPRAYLIANAEKPEAVAAFESLRGWLEARGQLAAAGFAIDPKTLEVSSPARMIVLGGDGTILAAARAMGALQIPIIGVNLGKLGYLAAYAVDDLRVHFDAAMSEAALVSERMTIQVTMRGPDGAEKRGIAINDCVILAGAAFRVIAMEMAVDHQPLTVISADGLIIATPTGSTAHNMSAGGPILEPHVEAMVLTPICPHSLTHRPVVMAPTTEVVITIQRANEGTTALIDGQPVFAARAGTVISVRRGSIPFRLVRHPARSPWQGLVQKLKWGQRPA